jgi:hypothetical protein
VHDWFLSGVLFRHTVWCIALAGSQIKINLVRASGESRPDRNDEEVRPRLQQGFWILAARDLANKRSLIRLEFFPALREQFPFPVLREMPPYLLIYVRKSRASAHF